MRSGFDIVYMALLTRRNSRELRIITFDQRKQDIINIRQQISSEEWENSKISSKIIWETLEMIEKTWTHVYLCQEGFASMYSWTFPTKETISQIADFIASFQASKIASFGCGLALLERLISDELKSRKQVEITAFDSIVKEDTYFPVTQLDVNPTIMEQLDKTYDIVILSWPPNNMPMAYNVVKVLKPKAVIYLGELAGGCVADDDFFGFMSEHYEEQIFEKRQWPGSYIIEYLCLFKRR